jgi:hypothetical protein
MVPFDNLSFNFSPSACAMLLYAIISVNTIADIVAVIFIVFSSVSPDFTLHHCVVILECIRAGLMTARIVTLGQILPEQ